MVAVVAITGLCLVFCAAECGPHAKPSACLAFYGVGAAAGYSGVGGAIFAALFTQLYIAHAAQAGVRAKPSRTLAKAASNHSF